MSVNKAILVGNVGKDPEVRYLDENTPVCKFPLATSETFRNRDGEKIEQTEWHNVVLWRGLAQVAEKYVKKGTQLYIEGRIKTRTYDDKDGVKKYITEIVGDNMQMLSRRTDDSQYGQGSVPAGDNSQSSASYTQGSQSQASSNQSATQQTPQADTPTGDMGEPDDLPF